VAPLHVCDHSRLVGAGRWNKLPETKGKTIAQVTKDFEKY
jgi:hypothetical protein